MSNNHLYAACAEILKDADRAAEQRSDGTHFYRVVKLTVEEQRLDEERDELVPTGLRVTWSQ